MIPHAFTFRSKKMPSYPDAHQGKTHELQTHMLYLTADVIFTFKNKLFNDTGFSTQQEEFGNNFTALRTW